jgi:hypothetical protein
VACTGARPRRFEEPDELRPSTEGNHIAALIDQTPEDEINAASNQIEEMGLLAATIQECRGSPSPQTVGKSLSAPLTQGLGCGGSDSVAAVDATFGRWRGQPWFVLRVIGHDYAPSKRDLAATDPWG